MNFIDNEIESRKSNAKKLAKKFPELKGLSYPEMLEKLPMELDFVTSSSLHEQLNKDI